MRTYTANNFYKKSKISIFKDMLKNIKKSRELIWQLFLRNFKAKYKQSLLGWAWLVLMPVITMGTFLLLNISGIIRIGKIPVPYPIFGLLGFTIWQVFANGWLVLTSSVASAGALVTQINFPKETLLISALGQVMVDFIIRFALVLIIYIIYGLNPSIWFILVPLFILPLFLLTLGLGFLTSVFNVIIRDTMSLLEVGLGFFLFLMPIMYTMPEKGFLAQFNKYNPIFFLVNAPRDIMISGSIKYPLEFMLSSMLSVFIFLIGWFVFYITQSKLAERI